MHYSPIHRQSCGQNMDTNLTCHSPKAVDNTHRLDNTCTHLTCLFFPQSCLLHTVGVSHRVVCLCDYGALLHDYPPPQHTHTHRHTQIQEATKLPTNQTKQQSEWWSSNESTLILTLELVSHIEQSRRKRNKSLFELRCGKQMSR